MSKFNTGSDLDIEKTQKGYPMFNGRVGIRGPDDAWAIELWGQNLFNKNLSRSRSTRRCRVGHDPRAAGGLHHALSTQLDSAFLGEPRTFGVTLRAKFGFNRPAPPAYTPPPAPPPPPATKLPDGR